MICQKNVYTVILGINSEVSSVLDGTPLMIISNEITTF